MTTGKRHTVVLLLAAIALLSCAATYADDRVPIRVWGMHMGEPRFGWYALIDEFERLHPHIRVVIGPTDRGQDLQKLLSGVVGNSPPDVFRRESGLFGDIAARDILMPLDEFLDQDKHLDSGLHKEDYYPGVWQQCIYDGHVYAIADALSPLVLAYNRDLFRKAGLDPDRPPRSWDELVECARKLTLHDESGNITQLGLRISGDSRDNVAFYIKQAGGDVLSPDGRTCTLDTDEGVRALTFLKSAYDVMGGYEAYQRFAATTAFVEALNIFGQGKLAMTVEDDWVIHRVSRYSPDIELGVAPVPTPTGEDFITMSPTGTVYMIPANAHHPKEAWDFIRFANSPRGQLAKYHGWKGYAETRGVDYLYFGFFGNRKVVEALGPVAAPTDPDLKAAYDLCRRMLEEIVPVKPSPVRGLLRDEMLRAFNRAGYGQMTPRAALADADRRVQDELDRYYGRADLPLLRWRYVWIGFAALLVLSVGIILKIRPRVKTSSTLGRYDAVMGPVFISPWIVGFLVLMLGPIVVSIVMSFCDYDVIHPARYVGWNNYRFMLTRDPLFWKSFGNTLYMVCSLPLTMTVSLGIALLLNAKVKGMPFYRAVFYLPAITPIVASAVLWYVCLNPNGAFNDLLRATICKWTGTSPPSWLQDPTWSKPAIILMHVWAAGGGMILWLAGLQSIPEQLYEAAAIDGAGWWRKFVWITLPMLTPYIFFSVIVGVIGIFQIFAQAVVLTQGQPADSTLFYVYYLFNNAFRYFKMGYASAQAWLLFVIILILTLLQIRGSKKWVHYG